jgi:hypothetical protein
LLSELLFFFAFTEESHDMPYSNLFDALRMQPKFLRIFSNRCQKSLNVY